MNRFFIVLIATAVVLFGTIAVRNQKDASKKLKLVTWSGYFPDSAIEEFTRKTGIPVVVSYISSNEELFSKLKAGAKGYDLIQPSDYMVEQMVRAKMLQPIQKDQLPHFEEIDAFYRHLPYDDGLNYSIPFVRGTTGILVNTKKVKIPEGDLSWAFLLNSPDPQHTSMLDDMREVFATVLYESGVSPNTHDITQLEKASQRVAAAKAKISVYSSEPTSLLLRGDVTIAHAYSTHAIQVAMQSKDFRYYLPKEGNSVWTDNLVIPASANNVKEAHIFMDYFLVPENARALVSETHLATPVTKARLLLPIEMQNDPILYPSDEKLARMRFLKSLENEVLSTMNRLWTEIRS